jgi:hypothetical protein
MKWALLQMIWCRPHWVKCRALGSTHRAMRLARVGLASALRLATARSKVACSWNLENKTSA